MDNRCKGCPDRSENMLKTYDWRFCKNKEIIERYNKDKGTKDRIPSCMYARTYYCHKAEVGE
jgi:hypothetical protein